MTDWKAGRGRDKASAVIKIQTKKLGGPVRGSLFLQCGILIIGATPESLEGGSEEARCS